MCKNILIIIVIVILGYFYINDNRKEDNNDTKTRVNVNLQEEGDSLVYDSKKEKITNDSNQKNTKKEITIEDSKQEDNTLTGNIDLNPVIEECLNGSELSDNSYVVSYAGEIMYEKQEDWYSFKAPYDGIYRVNFNEIQNGTYFIICIYDEKDNVIAMDSACFNGEGLTCKNLEAGKTYKIQVQQHTGFSTYSISIGIQKPVVDITGTKEIVDSIEYEEQRNIYYFTPPVSGRYRFDFSEICSGTDVSIAIIDSLGYTVAYDDYCVNRGGVTAKDLEAGTQYEIQVRQDNGYSDYKMTIGYQKSTVDISNLSTVQDTIEYTDQINYYSLVSKIDGNITITVSDLNSDVNFYVSIRNYLGESVASDNYFINGDSITIKNCTVGAQYEIQIRQYKGTGGYTLIIN